MRSSLISLLAMGIFFPILSHAETLKIGADGNYVFGERIKLADSSDAFYELTGTFTLTGALNSAESYIELGFAPFDSAGTPLQKTNNFSVPFDKNTEGYILIAILPLNDNGSVAISKRIQLGGAELKQVSFVVGAALSDGATVTVSDLKLTLVEESVLSVQTSSGVSAGEGRSSVSGFTTTADKAGTSLVKDKFVDLIKEEVLSQKETSLLLNLRRMIYVNADIGSDNFQGLKARRGQADGPKRTLRSAFRNIQSGDEIVLQESAQAFVVTDTIKPKPGETITIRAEGNALIKNSN